MYCWPNLKLFLLTNPWSIIHIYICPRMTGDKDLPGFYTWVISQFQCIASISHPSLSSDGSMGAITPLPEGTKQADWRPRAAGGVKVYQTPLKRGRVDTEFSSNSLK